MGRIVTLVVLKVTHDESLDVTDLQNFARLNALEGDGTIQIDEISCEDSWPVDDDEDDEDDENPDNYDPVEDEK
jgi:hypothetical protein